MYCGWTMYQSLSTVDFGNGVTVAASNDLASGIVKFAADGKAEWASVPVAGSSFTNLDASLDGSVWLSFATETKRVFWHESAHRACRLAPSSGNVQPIGWCKGWSSATTTTCTSLRQ